MKATSISTVAYNPGDPGGISNIADLVRFVREENLKIANAIRALAEGHLDMQTTPPQKPRAGNIRFADGVNWDPGSGQGIYYFDGLVWNQLG